MASRYERDVKEVTSGLASLSLRPVTVLSWNIEGPKHANARRRMIDSAISCIDPDVMLLQETTKSIISPTMVNHRLSSLDKYFSVPAGDKEEAQVFYKKNGEFEQVSSSTVNSKLDNILEEMFPKDENYQLRGGLSPEEKEIRNRICVVHLRHKRTKREIIFVSYHNIKRGGGEERGIARQWASDVCKIIAKLAKLHVQSSVIAGVDFNCVRFDSTDVSVPDYAVTLRRQEKDKIDYFILNNPPVKCSVKAYDLFPQEETAPFYATLQSLLSSHPETQKEQYKEAFTHDPLTLSLE